MAKPNHLKTIHLLIMVLILTAGPAQAITPEKIPDTGELPIITPIQTTNTLSTTNPLPTLIPPLTQLPPPFPPLTAPLTPLTPLPAATQSQTPMHTSTSTARINPFPSLAISPVPTGPTTLPTPSLSTPNTITLPIQAPAGQLAFSPLFHSTLNSRTLPSLLFTVDTPQTKCPRRAATLSAILPGLGQAYNQKYWKIPIVYAALGTSSYMIYSNNQQYSRYRDAYIARTDGDTATISTLPYTTENIRLRREYYRRNLELSVIITAGLYVLNILDAVVDAHLFHFDVSDDLTLNMTPEYKALTNRQYQATLNLKLSF